MHRSSRPSPGEGVRGWRLAGMSAACFLLPLAAAIVASAVTRGRAAGILASVAALTATMAATAGGAALVRRRRGNHSS